VETLKEFERVFSAALAAGRPTLIDAKITRWALPHYTSSPRGASFPGSGKHWKSVSTTADNFPLCP
jgi:hypothetical protein